MSYVPSCVMSVPLFSQSSAEAPHFPLFLFLGGPSYQASALLSLDAVICLCCGMLPQSIWTPSVLTVLVLNLLGTSLPPGPQDLLLFYCSCKGHCEAVSVHVVKAGGWVLPPAGREMGGISMQPHNEG